MKIVLTSQRWTMIAINKSIFKKKYFLQESLNYFGERRTDRRKGSMFQGVETPSQVIDS